MTVDKETNQVKLGTFIFERLSQIKNFHSVFGVPGDFNLPLLEHIYNVPSLNWIGNCNELNAGYAADGYARVNGVGALITTFGVGELSAINAISGAFTEGAGVIHIVGTSSTVSKRSTTPLGVHHLIPNKNTWDRSQDHFTYEKMVEPFCCVSETLDDTKLDQVQSQIDNVIEQVAKQSRPGYLFVPVNMANMDISVDPKKRLNFKRYRSDKQQAKELASVILERLYATETAIVGDQWFKTRRHKLNKFIKENGFHCFSTFLGKSVIDENQEHFHGVIAGELSTEGSLQVLDQFDAVLHLGVNHNEMNNFRNWSPSQHVKNVMEIGKDYVRIDNQLYTYVDGELVFDELVIQFDSTRLLKEKVIIPRLSQNLPELDKSANVSQKSLFQTVQTYLRPNDVVVCEMCSFLFAIPDLKFPQNITFVTQNFYGSIGYALPATLGASLAVKDDNSNRRVLLIEGDGSSQMTIQELSSLTRYNVKPTVLLLNNEGYSVERIVLGPERPYNDIQPNWQWTSLLKAFGDTDEKKSVNIRVDSTLALEKALNREDDRLKFIEIAGLNKLDVPWRFAYLCGKHDN